jgi:hypothetical protein
VLRSADEQRGVVGNLGSDVAERDAANCAGDPADGLPVVDDLVVFARNLVALEVEYA